MELGSSFVVPEDMFLVQCRAVIKLGRVTGLRGRSQEGSQSAVDAMILGNRNEIFIWSAPRRP